MPTNTLIPETATAYALETQAVENQTATAVAQTQQQETATAEAHAQAAAEATAAIEAYRSKAPKGAWIDYDGGIGVVVGDFRYTQSTTLFESGQGTKFVAFAIVIVNKSGSVISVNPHDVTLVDLDGYTYSYDVATYDYWSMPLDALEVQDGNQAQGGLVFKIRQKSGPAQVIFETGIVFITKVVVDLRRPPDEID
jgi:hypothetical protein